MFKYINIFKKHEWLDCIQYNYENHVKHSSIEIC